MILRSAPNVLIWDIIFKVRYVSYATQHVKLVLEQPPLIVLLASWENTSPIQMNVQLAKCLKIVWDVMEAQ